MLDPKMENKQAKPAKDSGEGEVFTLQHPDGRVYRTSSRVEANQLRRTAGYRDADVKDTEQAGKDQAKGGEVKGG